jgi:hypothetical protein
LVKIESFAPKGRVSRHGSGLSLPILTEKRRKEGI